MAAFIPLWDCTHLYAILPKIVEMVSVPKWQVLSGDSNVVTRPKGITKPNNNELYYLNNLRDKIAKNPLSNITPEELQEARAIENKQEIFNSSYKESYRQKEKSSNYPLVWMFGDSLVTMGGLLTAAIGATFSEVYKRKTELPAQNEQQ